MKAVRLIVFGVVLALFALFAFNNWTPVPFHRPDGETVPVALPIIVAAAFVLGWLPTQLIHWAARAQWRRRLAKAERQLVDALGAGPAGVTAAAAAGPVRPVLPVQAQPIVPPPAGA